VSGTHGWRFSRRFEQTPSEIRSLSLPLAYFITWTCRGQRLHGDERGTVDRSHNTPGSPYLATDPGREELARQAMVGDPVLLSPPMIPLVSTSIVSLCEERVWRLLACNVRPTHVHVVLNCRGQSSPERAMSQLKARATFALREAGLANATSKLWTRHGSTRWINHESGLIAAIAYVNDWQSGPNRELLEEHRRNARERVEGLRAWLLEQGLPDTGLTVVFGETGEERRRRMDPALTGRELGRATGTASP
jgi:REP element-mobilizing transposase RayT